jgi:hypothetical protein
MSIEHMSIKHIKEVQNKFANHNSSFTNTSEPQAYLCHACPEAFFSLPFPPLQTPLRFK